MIAYLLQWMLLGDLSRDTMTLMVRQAPAPAMADKLRTALKIEPPKPFIHPKSRRSMQAVVAPSKQPKPPEPVHIPSPPPSPALVTEPPKPRRNPLLETNQILRNQSKDRRNILATELEGYRKQETRLDAELTEVRQHIQVRMEEVRGIEESLSFLDMADAEILKLDDYLNKHRRAHQAVPHHRPQRNPDALSAQDVLKYVQLHPTEEITITQCRRYFGISDPSDVRSRDLPVRFNYLVTVGSVIRRGRGVYSLA